MAKFPQVGVGGGGTEIQCTDLENMIIYTNLQIRRITWISEIGNPRSFVIQPVGGLFYRIVWVTSNTEFLSEARAFPCRKKAWLTNFIVCQANMI